MSNERLGSWARRSVRRVCNYGAVAALAAGLLGCSLLGYTIGAKVDRSNARAVAVDGWDVSRLPIGAPVRAFRRDGQEVSGVFGGVGTPKGYAERYDGWRGKSPDAIDAPALGETVTIEGTDGQRQSGAFMGFEYAALSVLPSGSASSRPVPYGALARVSTGRGVVWQGPGLASLTAQGLLPLRSCMLLDKACIPLEEVDRVQSLQPGKTGKLVGLIVGAAVDALLIAAVAHSTQPTPTPSPWGSCPYVYAFDGSTYVQQGDLFPGAMFEAAQHADRLVLDPMVETEGSYRLRIANELRETEYIDDVRLLTVDSPDHGTVVPTPGGRLLSLKTPVAPSSVYDLRGQDARSRVNSEFGRKWVSDPLTADPKGRDGLIFEFPRPAGARAVTLVFRTEPTEWASNLLARVLALQGRDLPAWYARVNADAEARKAFFRAIRREGQLVLRVWTGAAWREVGSVPVHQAIELPLDDVPGEVLRVRLDCTAGLWTVRGALADFGVSSEAEITELPPVRALRRGGEDVRPRLAGVDGRRVVLEHGDSIDVAFDAPPAKPGFKRTLVLQGSGYYTVDVSAEGEPQPALFARLIGEPGALGRFSRDLLRHDLQRSLALASLGGEAARVP